MGLGIPPLKIKLLLESNPPKSRILVRRLAVRYRGAPHRGRGGSHASRRQAARPELPAAAGRKPKGCGVAPPGDRRVPRRRPPRHALGRAVRAGARAAHAATDAAADAAVGLRRRRGQAGGGLGPHAHGGAPRRGAPARAGVGADGQQRPVAAHVVGPPGLDPGHQRRRLLLADGPAHRAGYLSISLSLSVYLSIYLSVCRPSTACRRSASAAARASSSSP